MALYRNSTVIIRNIILITKNQHHQLAPILLCPAPNRWGIKRCFCLISICLMSVCLSRTSAHVTQTPLSMSKGQRSRSPGRFTHRRVGASGSCSGGRGNVLAVRNCCYVAVSSEALRRPRGEERGGGISWRLPAYNLLVHMTQ